jgi:hypothetical protein
MQCRLISHKPSKKRIAVLFQRDGQAFELIAPPSLKVPLETDFVILGIRGRFINHFVSHVFSLVDLLIEYRWMW